MAMIRTIAITALAALALSGCGNDAGNNDMKSVLVGIKERGLKVGGNGTQATPDTAGMVAGTSGPLRLVAFEKDGAVAGVQQIETNGAYRTFATADRRTVTFKHGVVTATRGLGNDLMSANVDGVLPLIRGRKAGSATRIMRYLNGENATDVMQFNCTVTPGASGMVANGQVRARVQTVTEQCQSDGQSFTASYQVTGKGEIVASRQWMSIGRGMADIKVLRR